MSETDNPTVPSEMYLLFEKGLFVGAFTEHEPAENTRHHRELSGKALGDIARYITFPPVTLIVSDTPIRCEHEVGKETKRWHEDLGNNDPSTCRQKAAYLMNGHPICKRHAGIAALQTMIGFQPTEEEEPEKALEPVPPQYRVHKWLQTSTLETVYGIQKRVGRGKWMNCREGDKALFFKSDYKAREYMKGLQKKDACKQPEPEPAPEFVPDYEVGDIIRRRDGTNMTAGSRRYRSAVCVSMDPFILVSPQGDRRWSSTIIQKQFYRVGTATEDMLATCMRRLGK